MDIQHFIHSSVDGPLNCLYFLDTLNIYVMFLCGRIFSFLEGIDLRVELLDLMIIWHLAIWGRVRNLTDQLHHFTGQRHSMRVSISPGPQQHSLSSDFLIIVILIVVKRHLIVALVDISLLANKGKQLFLGLWAIYISSLENCLFRILSHF